MRHWLVAPFRILPLALVAVLASVRPGAAQKWQPSPHVAATEPRSPEEQVKAFHLPPGFVIQLVAAEPKVKKPINIAFDAAGRLWVTESVEYPFPAPPDRKPKDTLKVLDDFGADGRARKVSTFADDLNIPIGVLPLGKGALVYSIPNVYHLDDAGGKAGQRQVVLSTYGHKDTHGMTGEFMRGFDGWVYACHGFSNTSEVKARGPERITMQSGNTYRFQPDGSRLEYFTHGQVNPFGLAFDPAGNLYSCDCHSRPIYQLLRGGWYPSFGRPHDGLGFAPEMLRHDHGSTAIAGITYYAAQQFPVDFRDNIFIGNVVTNRINRDRLDWHGSSPQAVALADFVKCDDPWFRPVDIKLGPDGAVYVADFYNRIIGHYEVPLNHPGRDRERGRIWRIVYQGDGGQALSPIENLTKLTTPQLLLRLDHDNLTVRLHATHLLADRGGAEVISGARQLLDSGSSRQQVHALWVLQRLGRLEEKSLARAAGSSHDLVRVHVMRVLGERSPWMDAERALALAGLKDASALVERSAADALARHPQAENVAPLLELRFRVAPADTHLLHVVRMALRDQLLPASTWAALPAFSEKESRALADVCPGAPSAAAADFLLQHLQRWPEDRANLMRYAHHIARHGTPEKSQEVMALVRTKYNDLQTQAAIFKALQQGTQERGGTLSMAERSWAEDIARRFLTSSSAADRQTGLELAGTQKMTSLAAKVRDLAINKKGGLPQRKSAVGALMAIAPQEHVELLSRILLDPGEPVEIREQSAVSLAGTNLAPAHVELVKALQSVPARLQKSIALALAGSTQGAAKLLEAVAAGKASARVLQDRAVELRLQQARVPNLANTLAKLTRGLPAADQRLQDLLGKRRKSFLAAKSDPAEGAKVFEKSCATCHQLSNKGAKIGPQLDGIGIRGLERLLEDILDPNRNVDQAFRSTKLNLKNGQIVDGLLLRQDGAVLVLADAQGKEVRVPGDTVEERLVVPLSPMPAGFAEQLPERDFNNLLAFLLAQRAK